MDNPFQQITLYLLFIRGPKVDDWVEGRHNQLQRTVLGDPTNGIPPAHCPMGETLRKNLRADFREAYQDTAAENRAVYLQLRKLRNIENRIDEYTNHFKVLETKWSQLDKNPQNLLNIKRRIDKCIKHFEVLRVEWSRLVKACLFCNRQGHHKRDCRNSKHSRKGEEVHSHRKLKPRQSQSKKPKKRKRSHLLMIQICLWPTSTK